KGVLSWIMSAPIPKTFDSVDFSSPGESTLDGVFSPPQPVEREAVKQAIITRFPFFIKLWFCILQFKNFTKRKRMLFLYYSLFWEISFSMGIGVNSGALPGKSLESWIG